MREAIGGTWLFGLVLTFIVFFASFLAVSINYSKAFNDMYLHKEFETLTREGIERLQTERLQNTVRHCMNSPFYKQRFEEIGLKPEDIHSIDDITKSAVIFLPSSKTIPLHTPSFINNSTALANASSLEISGVFLRNVS